MRNGRKTREIKRVRNETLVALRVIYPGPIQADQLFRSLLVLFPTLEFDHFKRDLHYLCDKTYVQRVETEGDHDPALIPWRRRWFRLTTSGIELADSCITDPALDES